jgi:hypothetical protein
MVPVPKIIATQITLGELCRDLSRLAPGQRPEQVRLRRCRVSVYFRALTSIETEPETVDRACSGYSFLGILLLQQRNVVGDGLLTNSVRSANVVAAQLSSCNQFVRLR